MALVVVLTVSLLFINGCGQVKPVGVVASSGRTTTPSPGVATGARTNFNCNPDAATPAKRAAPAVAYDPATKQVLYFGGTANTTSGYCDTWVWAGDTWTHLHPAHHPSGRSFAYMAFDYESNRMLLYGGGAYLNDPWKFDAWSWDGTDWTQLAGDSEPWIQTGWAMASAPRSGVFLIYGNGPVTPSGALFNTYRWTGKAWTLTTSAGPVRAEWPGFAYDPDLASLLLFGGSLSEFGPGSTAIWTWDGKIWTELNPAGTHPSGGNGSMTYDSVHKVMVWFGEDGTWTFDAKAWTQRATGAQSPPYGNWGTLTFDPVHGQVLLTGMMQRDGFGRTYGWNGSTWAVF